MERTSAGTPLEHRTLPVNGIELHAVLAGPADGEPVLLLHGFPEFWYGWRHQLGPLAQAGYRVIAPDLRGYNLSGKPKGAHQYLPELLQSDVLGLMDQLRIPQAHIVGHDWGGLIAWWLAEAHPGRLLRMIILNAPHPQAFLHTVKRRPTQQLRSGYLGLFQLPWIPEFLLQQQNYWLLAQTLIRTSRAGTFTSAELDHYREAWSQPGALGAMLSWYRAIPRYAFRASQGVHLSVPTLISWGDRDFGLNKSLATDSFAKCDNGRLERLAHAGHWLQHEERAQVNRQILEFLAEGVKG